MRVFVTGVEGYIGALLAPLLVRRGHDVVGLDTGFYRDGWLYSDRGLRSYPRLLNKDTREITDQDLKGFDAVVHLAELSNDPLGQIRPDVTRQINHLASVGLASKAKAAGVKRFLWNSSCSVYGVGKGEFLDEDAPVNPQTAYAECKVLVERDVSQLADVSFSPVFFRCATAYGPSPRMRFDVVLNNLAGLAWTTKRIAMVSDGTPWRPLVHVLDICKAIACALEAPRESVHNQIFNVGDDRENYQIREIAQIVAAEFPGCEVTTGPPGGDNRSYRVSFDKINHQLPGFRCEHNAQEGARQLRDLFERIEMGRETFEFRAFTRLKQLQYLLRTKQIDDAFNWRT
ncbi:MAG TPA: SDR family oxidoreductase [Thermoplasmata archaeon]|nr:SDR family oxidoreductase [Thermoplasmata archaeon]